jgi:hypothetical protein
MADRISGPLITGAGAAAGQVSAADIESLRPKPSEAQPSAIAPLATQHQLKATGAGVRTLDAGRLESPAKGFMSTMATRHHVGRILQKLPQTDDSFGKLAPMLQVLKSYHAWTNDIVRVLGRV